MHKIWNNYDNNKHNNNESIKRGKKKKDEAKLRVP
jgi:hypothetical protein